LTLGHRRFAILSMLPPVSSDRRRGPFYHAPGSRNRQSIGAVVDARERLLGYADALAEAGLSIDETPIVEAYLNPPGVSDGARMLLDEAPKATAILATADNLALGVISEARHRGIAVPRDLSVVGWDDVVEAVSAEPPLTTVAQPIKEKGRIAARIVLNPPPRPRHEILPVRLVVRASTGPAPD
jgi:DNA-binding LacI/PurR family transcriptional regulator